MKNLHWWLALGCIPLYGFWTMPYLSNERPTLQQSVQIELNKTERLGTRMSSLQSQQQELLAETEKPTESIPVVLEQEYLLLDLRRITQGSGFSAQNFAFTKGQNVETDAAQVGISFSAEGNRSNLVKLLKSIESNKRFLGMEDLSFSTSGVSDQVINISLNLYALAQRF